MPQKDVPGGGEGLFQPERVKLLQLVFAASFLLSTDPHALSNLSP